MNTSIKRLLSKIKKSVRRHPLIYYFRYVFLSENSKGNIDELGCINDINDPADVPEIFYETNRKIVFQPGSEIEKAISIGTYLRKNTPVGPAVSSTSDKTLRDMLYGKGGVCNDFSQVFNLFCLINNIRVREWNLVDRFYRTRFGHTFNEIFDTRLGYWVAIDIHKGIYFMDDGRNPLPAIEVFKRFRAGLQVNIHYYSDYRPPHPGRLQKIYSAESIPFIITNYRNNVVDKFLERYEKMPPFVPGLMMILARKNYRFAFVLDDYRKKLLPFLAH